MFISTADQPLPAHELRADDQALGIDVARAWYVLLIEPQHERIAAAHLIGRGLKAYFPTVPCLTTRGLRRLKITVHRPMMPGYLFVHLNFFADQTRLRYIPHAPGIHSFLRIGERYAVVPDADMARAEKIAEELAKPKPVQSMWSVGEVVRIDSGPFCGLRATIMGLYSKDRIRVEIPFKASVIPVELDAANLDKL